MIQSDVTDFIVIACFPVIEVDTHQVTVQTDVELLFLMSTGEMTDIKSVSKEYPSPSEIRTDAVGHLWCKRYRLARLTTDAIGFVGIGVLQHYCIVVMLWLDIGGVDFVEVFEIAGEEVSHLMGDIFLCCRHFLDRWFSGEHNRVGHLIHGGNILYHRQQYSCKQPSYPTNSQFQFSIIKFLEFPQHPVEHPVHWCGTHTCSSTDTDALQILYH